MNSTSMLKNFDNLSPREKNTQLFFMVQQMYEYDVIIEDEEGKEMAKILYQFIQINSHLFSKPILEAAERLFEEIQKAEAEVSNYVERII